jgi:hypothetical protein
LAYAEFRFDRMCVFRTRVDAAMKQLPAVDCAFLLPAARGAVLQLIQLFGACATWGQGVPKVGLISVV